MLGIIFLLHCVRHITSIPSRSNLKLTFLIQLLVTYHLFYFIYIFTRKRPIRGLMPMSDVPMLVWLNCPIPIPMFKASTFPTCHTQHTHEKCRKMQHMQGWNRFRPCMLYFIINKNWLIVYFRSFDLHRKPWLCWVRQVGNEPNIAALPD